MKLLYQYVILRPIPWGEHLLPRPSFQTNSKTRFTEFIHGTKQPKVTFVNFIWRGAVVIVSSVSVYEAVFTI